MPGNTLTLSFDSPSEILIRAKSLCPNYVFGMLLNDEIGVQSGNSSKVVKTLRAELHELIVCCLSLSGLVIAAVGFSKVYTICTLHLFTL